MEKCIICKSEMKLVNDKPVFPNKKIIVSSHYKCEKCGCQYYYSNILEVASQHK